MFGMPGEEIQKQGYPSKANAPEILNEQANQPPPKALPSQPAPGGDWKPSETVPDAYAAPQSTDMTPGGNKPMDMNIYWPEGPPPSTEGVRTSWFGNAMRRFTGLNEAEQALQDYNYKIAAAMKKAELVQGVQVARNLYNAAQEHADEKDLEAVTGSVGEMLSRGINPVQIDPDGRSAMDPNILLRKGLHLIWKPGNPDPKTGAVTQGQMGVATLADVNKEILKKVPDRYRYMTSDFGIQPFNQKTQKYAQEVMKTIGQYMAHEQAAVLGRNPKEPWKDIASMMANLQRLDSEIVDAEGSPAAMAVATRDRQSQLLLLRTRLEGMGAGPEILSGFTDPPPETAPPEEKSRWWRDMSGKAKNGIQWLFRHGDPGEPVEGAPATAPSKETTHLQGSVGENFRAREKQTVEAEAATIPAPPLAPDGAPSIPDVQWVANQLARGKSKAAIRLRAQKGGWYKGLRF